MVTETTITSVVTVIIIFIELKNYKIREWNTKINAQRLKWENDQACDAAIIHIGQFYHCITNWTRQKKPSKGAKYSI